jgi:hypothetical protein
MPSPNPLNEAEVLQHYGRTKQAITILRDALQDVPNQPDLQAKLFELETSLSTSPVINLRALFIPWLLFLSSAVFSFGPLIAGAKFLNPFPSWFSYGTGLVLLFALGSIILIAAIFLWVQLFLHSWFTYLRTLPSINRAEIEAVLPRYFNVIALEPTYSRVRKKFGFHDGA